jgi:hypothetical protein
MHKTQLYLEESQYLILRDWAVKRKKSIAQLVREMIDMAIAPKQSHDPLFDVLGIASTKHDNVSRHVDDYLYGDDETIRRLEKEGMVGDRTPKRKKKRSS